jgi:hypothetical protein
LTVRAAVDPVQKPVRQGVLEQAYAACRKAYRAGKAEKSLSLHAD